jgi:hypothetical protein
VTRRFMTVWVGTVLLFALTAGSALATEPLAFTVTVNPAGSFDPHTGIATVSGSYSCNQASTVDALQLFVSQSVGRFSISGSGQSDAFPGVACLPGESYLWTLQVFPSNGKFAGGKATAYMAVWGETADEFTSASLGPFPTSLKR